MEETVTLSRWYYDSLVYENNSLKKKNEQLEKALQDLQDNDGQKVIIRESTYEDYDVIREETYVKGFDDVRDEVRKFYEDEIKRTIEMAEEQKKKIKLTIEMAEEQKKKIEELVKSSDEKTEKLLHSLLDAQMDVSRLKSRNLWQRIWNK